MYVDVSFVVGVYVFCLEMIYWIVLKEWYEKEGGVIGNGNDGGKVNDLVVDLVDGDV